MEALVSYAFLFGDFALMSVEEPDPEFFVSWSDVPGSVFGMSLSSFLSDDPENPGKALAIVAHAEFEGGGWATVDGWSREIPGCCIESSLGNAGQLTLVPIGAAPVPLPAAGWLLAASIFGLGIAAGRRRACCISETLGTQPAACHATPSVGYPFT